MANKTFQKHKKLNPAVNQLQIEKSIKTAMDKAKASGIEYGIIVYKLISLMVMADKFGMTDDDIDKFSKQIDEYAESIIKDYMTVPDIIKVLKEEHNFSISEEKLIKYYPNLEGYLYPDDTKNSD